MVDGLALALVALPLAVVGPLLLPRTAGEALLGLPLRLVLTAPGIVVLGAAESSAWCATPGKRLFGLQTLHEDGTPLSLQHALLRNASKWLLLALCGILGLSVFSNPQRSGLWDLPFSSRTVSMGDSPAGSSRTPTELGRPQQP